MSRRVKDWIDGWLEFRDNTEPPVIYNLWTAFSVLSATLERKVFVHWFDKLYPNLYVILVGPPGRTRKGTAMSPGLSILRRLEQLNLAAEATTKEALVDILKRSSVRSAQLADPAKPYNYAAMTIWAQELSVFLGYGNAELMSWLCDWFDSRPEWTYRTKSGGEQSLTNIWVSLFGAITPALIQGAMPSDIVGGGLASRAIFVYETTKRKTVVQPFPYDPITQRFNTIEADDLEEDLFQDLQQIHNLKGQFKFTQDYLDFWKNWYSKETPPLVEDHKMEGYRTRRPTHLLKLSMLCNISYTDEMVLTRRDGERALSYLEEVEKKMHLTFAGLGRSDLAMLTQEIMQMIAHEKQIAFSTILSRVYSDTTAEELGKIIATLMHMKYCSRKIIEGSVPVDWWIIYLGDVNNLTLKEVTK